MTMIKSRAEARRPSAIDIQRDRAARHAAVAIGTIVWCLVLLTACAGPANPRAAKADLALQFDDFVDQVVLTNEQLQLAWDEGKINETTVDAWNAYVEETVKPAILRLWIRFQLAAPKDYAAIEADLETLRKTLTKWHAPKEAI